MPAASGSSVAGGGGGGPPFNLDNLLSVGEVGITLISIQSDPDLPGPDLPEPRFNGRIIFPRYRKLTISDPDIPGTPIYRVKPFPPSIPVNRGPTVSILLIEPVPRQKGCSSVSTL
eukprot:sb/3476606/